MIKIKYIAVLTTIFILLFSIIFFPFKNEKVPIENNNVEYVNSVSPVKKVDEKIINGKRQGKSIVYTSDGVKYEERTYKDDVLSGPFIINDIQNNIRVEVIYNDGTLEVTNILK